MNPAQIGLTLLALPILFQLVFGSLSVAGKIRWQFNVISLISLLSGIVFSFTALKIFSDDFSKEGPKCAMPMMAILALCVIAVVVLIVLVIVQWIVKGFVRRRKPGL